jgi:hypothetical protein
VSAIDRALIGFTHNSTRLLRTGISLASTQNSHQIPLIPPIHFDSQGEIENPAPPKAAGSDTWESVGTYQFNAFYDRSLHVQQLDFGGPPGALPCAVIRW